MPSADDVLKHSVHTLVFRSLKRTHDMFRCDQGMLPPAHLDSENAKRAYKRKDQYGPVLHRVKEAKKVCCTFQCQNSKPNIFFFCDVATYVIEKFIKFCLFSAYCLSL